MEREKRYHKTDSSALGDPLMGDYLKFLTLSSTARGPYTLIRRHLVLFSEFLAGESVLAMNHAKASEFVTWLCESYPSYSAGYITNIIKSIKGFYRYQIKHKRMLTEPFAYVSLPKVARMLPRDIPSDRQIRSMIREIPSSAGRDRAVIELLYGSGIRAGELLALKTEDLNPDEKYITICDSKSKKERNVPVNDLTCYAVTSYLEGERKQLLQSSPNQKRRGEHRVQDQSILFLKEGGFPLCRWKLSQIIETYRKKADLPFRLTPHSFRHACATAMLSSGCPLRYVQALLGHEDVETTMIYTRLSTDSLKQALDEVHPRGKG